MPGPICGFFGVWAGNIALSTAATAAGASVLNGHDYTIDPAKTARDAALGSFVGSIALGYGVYKLIQKECNPFSKNIFLGAFLVDLALIAANTAFTAAAAGVLGDDVSDAAIASATGSAIIYSTLAVAGSCLGETAKQCLS